MSDLANVELSLFDGSFDSHPQRTVTLAYILDGVGTGRYARQVRYVRQVLATRGKAAYDQAKRSLPAVTFAGTFAPTRGNAHLQRHSGLLHIDMDHLSDVAATKRALSDDPSVVFVYTSPSGGGAKSGVLIPAVTTAEEYAHAWRVVKAAHEQRYGVTWDEATKDVARLCYLSYDPELFVNFNAEIFDVPPVPAPEPKPPTPHVRRMPLSYHPDRRRMYAERAIRAAVQMITCAPDGARHAARLKASRLLGGYVASGLLAEAEAFDALERAAEGNTDHPASARRTIADGLRYGQAHPISLDDLEAEREAWLREHRPVTPLNRPTPMTDSAWAGMNTLPIRPFSRRHVIRTPGRQVHNG